MQSKLKHSLYLKILVCIYIIVLITTIPPLNPSPPHLPLVKATDMAKSTKTTTSETTVTPKKPRVKGPLALNSLAMAMALAGERAVMMAPKSIAMPVKHPLLRLNSATKELEDASMARTTPVTSAKVITEMAATDKKIVLNKSRSSGKYSSAGERD